MQLTLPSPIVAEGSTLDAKMPRLLVSNSIGKPRHRVARNAAECRAVRVRCGAMPKLLGKSDAPDKREIGGSTPPRPTVEKYVPVRFSGFEDVT